MGCDQQGSGTDADRPSRMYPERQEPRTAASYECELAEHRDTERRLREALAREEVVLRRKDGLINQLGVLSKESDHRFLNNLQMVSSLLSLQSQDSVSPDVAAQLANAAKRVATIARVHRRLHSLDGKQTVEFKWYLDELCRDYSTMLPAEERTRRAITVEGIKTDLAVLTAMPLAFIVNELITNAIKHGKGRIIVRLDAPAGRGYALSVSNDGPALPKVFDPVACHGLGMSIVMALVKQIDGELQFGQGDNSQGARFTVLFPRANL
jgi:two-component sensor histidine kinase